MPLVWVLRPTAGLLAPTAFSGSLSGRMWAASRDAARRSRVLALPAKAKSCLDTARASLAEASRGDVEGSGGRAELAETLEPARLNARLL